MDRPSHDPAATKSFFHLVEEPPLEAECCGLACFAARADDEGRWHRARRRHAPIHCLGQCHVAPAVAGHPVRPHPRVASPRAVLLDNVIHGGVHTLGDYAARGGGRGLERADEMAPDELIEVIARAKLRGRGGAGFSAGRKWAAVREAGGAPVIVVNADEGDPGAFSDKALLEDDPFRLIEGIAIAGRAVGASEATIYLRCEYPDARRRVEAAIEAARSSPYDRIEITLVSGGGSFVCGEETSLLNALEARRPFARVRPPYPVQHGLHGRPTLVHNVETLCAVPWIAEHGAEAYRALGSGESAGTKLVSLNSLFERPGLVEVPFGISLRTIVEEIGGGIRRGDLLGVMIGGPLAGLLPPDLLDTPFTYEDLAAAGGAVGHGGVIAFADDTSVASLIAEVFRFGAGEACGLCVPCHRGTSELSDAFETLIDGRAALSRERWDALVAALEQASLCGHGTGLAEFARSIERHYPEQLAECLR